MQNSDQAFEMRRLREEVTSQNKLIQQLFDLVHPAKEMWDDQDMIQNWKVSKRTLASWRAEGKIAYVQVGNKIWYPREARERFIASNLFKMKEGENE